MIERIDLFMPPRSRYEVLQAFTRSLAKSLQHLGVRCRILEAEKNNPKQFIDELLSDPPECTLSFNGLLPDAEGHFFCDLLKIPHVACLVDSPQHFVTLTQSPYSIITAVDRFSCDFFSGLNFQRALFMPHGVDGDLIRPPNSKTEKRIFDLLFPVSFVDINQIQKDWKEEHSLAFRVILEDTVQTVLADRDTPCYLALAKALDRHVREFGEFDPKQIDFLKVLDQLEDYVKGKSRIDLLNAISDEITVHIVGVGEADWIKMLKRKKNLVFHESVTYAQVLEMMRQSKVVLNSSVHIKDGAHERIFAGIASGAAVMTNENIFMHQNFKNRDNILFYDHSHLDQINPLLKQYINNADDRESLVLRGQEVVKNGHSWDFRAANLVRELTPILNKMKTVTS